MRFRIEAEGPYGRVFDVADSEDQFWMPFAERWRNALEDAEVAMFGPANFDGTTGSKNNVTISMRCGEQDERTAPKPPQD